MPPPVGPQIRVGQTACHNGASIQYGASKSTFVPRAAARACDRSAAGPSASRRHGSRSRLESGGGAEVGREQRPHLVEREVGRLAGNGATLDQALGAVRDHERRVAALGEGDHQVAAALAHGGRALVDGDHQPRQARHRVDAEVRLRAVRRTAGEAHPHESESAQGPGEREAGRLGDQADVGPDAEAGQRGDDGLAADARVLLVGDQGEDGTHRRARRDQVFRCRDDRRDPALHVRRATTQQPVAVDRAVNGAGMPLTPTVST